MKQPSTAPNAGEQAGGSHAGARRLWKLAAAGGLALGVLAPASAAFAADYPDGGTAPATHSDPGVSTEVKGATVSKGSLPFTGGDVAGLAAIGAGAVVVGGVLASQSRRRRAAEPR